MSELDFSEFHPLDHTPFTAYCFGWYGGPFHHVKLWWDYKFEWRPYAIAGRFNCKVRNKHSIVEYWSGEQFKAKLADQFADIPATGEMCEWCDYVRKYEAA